MPLYYTSVTLFLLVFVRSIFCMLAFWVSVPKAAPCLVNWAFLKVPSSCTTGLFFSWALSKFSLESRFTREDQGACYLGTCPSHLCSQSPPVTFNLLKAFSWLLHWCLSRWAAREAVRKPDKLWQPLCNTIDPGSRQAADLPRWPIWLPNRMLHPTEGKDTNHYCLSWHLHRIGLNSVTWGVQLTVPPSRRNHPYSSADDTQANSHEQRQPSVCASANPYPVQRWKTGRGQLPRLIWPES